MLKSKRLIKALKRAERRKFNDFFAVLELGEKGYLSITGPSDDAEITITEKGLDALAQMKQEQS